MNAEFFIAGILGLAAAVEDLARRTISNWIPLTALLGGLLCQSTRAGWGGAGTALLGVAGGFGVFLVFYLLGGMGGGDVKLMAGFGALLGAGRLLEAAFWTAVFGGLLATLVLAAGAWKARRKQTPLRFAPKSIPYAPAIVLGVWLTLITSR